jgi:hypothetical protein
VSSKDQLLTIFQQPGNEERPAAYPAILYDLREIRTYAMFEHAILWLGAAKEKCKYCILLQ